MSHITHKNEFSNISDDMSEGKKNQNPVRSESIRHITNESCHAHELPSRTHGGITEWRRCNGCLKLHVSFRKRAINCMALLWDIAEKDKATYALSLRCKAHTRRIHVTHVNESYHTYKRVLQYFWWLEWRETNTKILCVPYSVATMHRITCLCRSYSTREACNHWLCK